MAGEIIGHGDIASVLIPTDGLRFFASGVSNSTTRPEAEYTREIDLLFAQPKDLRLVYFSSLCVFYSDTRYGVHKREMEAYVKVLFPLYTIIRIGNITWGDNPHTLINFLRNRHAQGLPLQIQDTTRYLVDQDEFLHWINLIPAFNCEMNIPGRTMTVQQVVDEFV